MAEYVNPNFSRRCESSYDNEFLPFVNHKGTKFLKGQGQIDVLYPDEPVIVEDVPK